MTRLHLRENASVVLMFGTKADININSKLEAGRHLDPFVKVMLRPVKSKKNDTQWLDIHQHIVTVMKDE